jgi:hypothetical protein
MIARPRAIIALEGAVVAFARAFSAPSRATIAFTALASETIQEGMEGARSRPRGSAGCFEKGANQVALGEIAEAGVREESLTAQGAGG